MISGAAYLVKALQEEQVEILFNYPGAATIDIMDELYKQDTVKVVLPRHEQALAHAADGYARSTGKVGVCMVTSGPGATNLVTGIATAYADSVPLVCITGPFDGVVRSLLVCIYELGVNEIFIIGHHECGMSKTTAKDLTEKMLARGIAPEAIHMVKREMERWADGFTHPAENVEDTVDELRVNPLIPKDVPIHGLIFHPRTGEIEVIVNGYTQMKQYYEK